MSNWGDCTPLSSERDDSPHIEYNIMADHKKLGNHLGENKIKAWSPTSMRPPTFKGPGQGKVAPANRPGAGAKQ